jgi:hypothetical protein
LLCGEPHDKANRVIKIIVQAIILTDGFIDPPLDVRTQKHRMPHGF